MEDVWPMAVTLQQCCRKVVTKLVELRQDVDQLLAYWAELVGLRQREVMSVVGRRRSQLSPSMIAFNGRQTSFLTYVMSRCEITWPPHASMRSVTASNFRPIFADMYLIHNFNTICSAILFSPYSRVCVCFVVAISFDFWIVRTTRYNTRQYHTMV